MLISKNYIGDNWQKVKFTFKRENWKEWFRIVVTKNILEDISFGEQIPRFYLPVKRSLDFGNNYRCYLFPIAPFVLFWFIVSDVAHIIWQDLLYFSYDLKYWLEVKRRK